MVSQKVKGLETKLSDVQKNIEQLNSQTQGHASDLKQLQDDVKQMRAENVQTGEESKKLRNRLDEIEDRSRRNNLLFFGINQDTRNETWEESENRVKEVIKTKLDIHEDILIERAHRISKGPKSSGTAPIIVKFNNFKGV
jgi:outer membrane murein-binding lipoprotein Lpp